MSRAVRVLRGRCARHVGTVTEHANGTRVLTITIAGGGWTSTPLGMWCPDHGWPDLRKPEFEEKLKFTGEGKTRPYKAKMLPHLPRYQ